MDYIKKVCYVTVTAFMHTRATWKQKVNENLHLQRGVFSVRSVNLGEGLNGGGGVPLTVDG